MTATVPIGLLVPTRQAVIDGRVSVRDLVQSAVTAEAIGYDSVWVGESITARPRPDAFALLGALAMRTSTVTLGTAALLPALRNPILAAQALATVDQMAEGRLIVGVGAGFANPQTEHECAALGVNYRRRFSATLEAVRCWKTLWAGEACSSSFDGSWDFAEVSLRPLPEQPGGPPVWLGGATEATQRRVGAHFDGWMPTSNSTTAFSEGLARCRASAIEHGRDGSEIVAAPVATVAVADGPGARASLERFLRTYYDTEAELEDILAVVGGVAGSVEACAEWLAKFVNAGAERLIIRFASSDPLQAVHEHGETLLAAVRGAIDEKETP